MVRLFMLPLLLFAVMAEASVFCRGGSTNLSPTTPTDSFIMKNDGTVIHKTTGLMWMRCPLGKVWKNGVCNKRGKGYSLKEALVVAKKINSGESNDDNDNAPGFAGHTDWRLPNIGELASTVEKHCLLPAFNDTPFPYTPPDGAFWSSTLDTKDSSLAFRVYNIAGTQNVGPNELDILAEQKGGKYYINSLVRLVRTNKGSNKGVGDY